MPSQRSKKLTTQVETSIQVWTQVWWSDLSKHHLRTWKWRFKDLCHIMQNLIWNCQTRSSLTLGQEMYFGMHSCITATGLTSLMRTPSLILWEFKSHLIKLRTLRNKISASTSQLSDLSASLHIRKLKLGSFHWQVGYFLVSTTSKLMLFSH